ncbi:MAG: ABC transporter permease subunit, partial [Rhodoferax sp.]|nr:ABC transporter permease subunit [Rhodoferax sp.]
MDFTFAQFLHELWIARAPIVQGLGVTIVAAALAIVTGSVLGVGVGLALTYGAKPLRWLTRAYTDFIRGTPVLVLVLASYYILGAAGVQLSPFQAGVLALAVFCSSHVG